MKTKRFSHITDNELLQRFEADRDLHWIGILLERYTLLLLGVCMKYLKDEDQARDCVQQIFLKVLTEVSRFKIEYFKSWLYMVAKNHCLMLLRNQQNLQELTEGTAQAASEPSPADFAADEHTYRLLEEAIGELSEEQRQCVTLFYLQKNSYQQIVEKTGYSSMKVKSYIQNGKRNLRLLMEKKLKQNKASF